LSAPADAASVILLRGSEPTEIYVVRRAATLRFFGGFYAFPGGSALKSDRAFAERCAVQVRHVAAVRELFEETGVLLARNADGVHAASSPDWRQWRDDLINERAEFGALLIAHGLTLHAEDLQPIGDLVTPEYSSVRFDTTFYLARTPYGQDASVWPGELDHGEWIVPSQFLARWTRGECLIAPPALRILETRLHGTHDAILTDYRSAVARGLAEPFPRIVFSPGVQTIPLRTLALPPVTHTNAYLVGENLLYLIDPGPSDAAEQERLFAAVHFALKSGRRLQAVVLSHHHPDHVGAAARCAEVFNVPIWAHALTPKMMKHPVRVDRFLDEGDTLPLGIAPDGRGDWHLRVLHTPGHAPSHLAFFDPLYHVLFAGDMISTQTSMIVAPPEGDLTVYLDSLRRLQEFDCRLLLPSHGGPTARPREILQENINHRLRREEQLLTALAEGPRTVADLAIELYKGLPPAHMRFGELQIQAGLQKLQRESKAEPVAEQAWRLCAKL
jgi:ribonuclease/clavin/mitogillin